MANLAPKTFLGVLMATLFLAVFSVQAIPVRIASYNMYFGIDTGSDRASLPADDDFAAVVAGFERVQPDIVCFQELLNSDKQAWLEAAATLGYSYYAFSSVDGGTFAGDMRLGVWSKYPILWTDEIKETDVDPDAAEMTRWPLHAVIDVPGALNPFHVFSIHNKSGTTVKSERLRRAFEMYRTVNYITNMVATYPLDTEYAVMGDFNDTIEGAVGAAQNDEFPLTYYEERLAAGTLGTTYNDGFDIPWNTDTNWMMPYKFYPTDRLDAAGMEAVVAAHTGGTNNWTHDHGDGDGYRLDYILFSDEIMSSPYGAPEAEVLFSPGDGSDVGLTKYGSPLDYNTSSNASDHRMVFCDFNLIDAVPGVTPVAILSEVVDYPSTTDGNYVEIANTGSSDLDLTDYSIAVYLNGSTNPTLITLSGTLGAGGVQIVAASTNAFLSTWGVPAQWQDSVIAQLDGNDTLALRKADGNTSDIYGQIGSVPGAWGFAQSTAIRNTGVSDPLSTWDYAEWTITASTNSATPGEHVSLTHAEAFVSSGPSLVPSAPRASNTFAIAVGLTPNLVASNLAATGIFRIAGGSWIEAAMTNASGTDWQTPSIDVAKSEGDVMEYVIRYSVEGPQGFTTNSSSTNSYTFPIVGASGGNIKAMFNEVQADGAGADTNEFIEIIAAAGVSLEGFSFEHRNGSDSTDGAIWTYTFPTFIVPDDGITDVGGNALGFAVISQDSNTVVNTDFLLPGSLLNKGDGLILYDDSGNILDAVVWEGDPYDIGVDDPDTVFTNVPPGSTTYLHTIGNDSSTDNCPQAPNNILMSTGTWVSASATPGAINATQVSGEILIAPGDVDLDGLLDNVDNCPDTANATQIDTDGDGLGDACDTDIDGDGVLNTSDNCEYNPNADQSDIDGDGLGDECDPDADGDGIPNESDPEPYHTGILDVDFEDANLKSTAGDLTPHEVAGRMWVFSNATVVSASSDSGALFEGTRGAVLNDQIGGIYLQGALTNGIGDFEFAYARYASDRGVEIEAQYNTGAGWVTITTVNTLNVTTQTTNSTMVNVVGPVDFRIRWSSDKNQEANLDNIYLNEYTPSGVASCTLDAPALAAFDGSAHTAIFTVTPLGIPYSVDWSPSSPVGVGIYDATVTIPDTETILGGTFVFTNALTITQNVATCEIVAPVSTGYDGLAHTNIFTVTTGLVWNVSYSPSDPPVSPGDYDVTVTVVGDENYLGGPFIFSNAVTISPGQATCALDEAFVVNYDGAVHTNTFTVMPTGLAWSVSYSPSLPQAVGVYDVTVAVLGSEEYVGTTNVYSSAVVIQPSGTGGEAAVGDLLTIDFEDPLKPDYNAYGPHTNTLTTHSPSDWFLHNATRGNLANDKKNGSYSIRLRYIGADATSNGMMQSTVPFSNGIHSVAFNYAVYGTLEAVTLSVETSPDGVEWTTSDVMSSDGVNTNFVAYSNTLSVAEATYLRFQMLGGDRMNIDDIMVLPYAAVSQVGVTLSNLAQTYDETAQSVTVMTDPSGLATVVSYDGSYAVPSTAGSFTVVATVAESGYAGSATGTLVIAKATAAVSLSDLLNTYDGNSKSATVTTDPAGLGVTVTYNGSATLPVATGSYTVVATVAEANYTGFAFDTLVITASATTPFEDWLTDQSLDPVDARYATDMDDDGDGMTTYEEFVADTDPTLVGSILTLTGTYSSAVTSNGTGVIRLSFPASTGRYYQLVYSTNLVDATSTRNLGWGVPGMVITNDTSGIWFGKIRSRLTAP